MSPRRNCEHTRLTRYSNDHNVWICDNCGVEITVANVPKQGD